MSFGLSSSLASGRNPESSYRDSSASDRDHRTPSPPVHQDEYTPTRQSVRSITWTTPSQRSNTASISSSTRIALDKLYKKIYGEDSLRCLLMQTTGGLNIAHAVRRASKSDELTLYEYCLGFGLGTFHVDSRRNLFYLAANWHIQFDARKWFLLPDMTALQDVRDFVQSTITARKDPTGPRIQTFRSKWYINTKTMYTFIPLPSIERDPCTRRKLTLSETPQPFEQWVVHTYPYQTLPDLECHIAPPLAVINGGPKCAGLDLDAIARVSCQTNESREALKRRLELLCETWALFDNAMGDAKDWEQGQRGKRKRDHDDEDIERFSQSSQRTTRSQSRSTHSSAKSKLSTPQNDGNTTGNRCRGSGIEVELTQTSRARKRAPSSSGTTLTEGAVLRLGKRRKMGDLDTMVRRWAESACGRVSEAVL